jgi:hypothetical protein
MVLSVKLLNKILGKIAGGFFSLWFLRKPLNVTLLLGHNWEKW